MKILLAPDKFKGTLTAQEVCEALAAGLNKNQQHEIRQMPLADGGEGTQEFFLKHLNGKQITVPAHDPLMRPMRADYILSSDGKTVFIEMSRTSGLSLLKANERNPMFTTTFGTGEQVRHALDASVEQIILGIGGSSTNDAGLGLLCAIGVRMLDEQGQEFIPRGESIINIKRIDLSLLHPRVKRTKFTSLCDVQNPFYGDQGAAHVYAPQKGATPEQVLKLDLGLKHVAGLIKQQTGIDLQQTPGSGAGGGIAGGLHAFLNAKIESGIQVIFDLILFAEAVAWADVVITGEGKLDAQTLQGKVVAGVAREANKQKKPVLIVCGKNELNADQARVPGVRSITSLLDFAGKENAMTKTRKALEELATQLATTL
jgi:glycerate kinase